MNVHDAEASVVSETKLCFTNPELIVGSNLTGGGHVQAHPLSFTLQHGLCSETSDPWAQILYIKGSLSSEKREVTLEMPNTVNGNDQQIKR